MPRSLPPILRSAPFRLRLGTLLVLAVGSLTLASCSDSSTAPGKPAYETDLSVPDNVLKNFQLAYNNRDLDAYERLLSHDFHYEFRQFEALEYPDGFDREQELVATRSLFESDAVTGISLDMERRAPSAMEWKGDPVQAFGVIQFQLDVVRSDVTLRVTGQEQIYMLRLGSADHGEDPDSYYLREWIDAVVMTAQADPMTESTHWGQIKAMFYEESLAASQIRR